MQNEVWLPSHSHFLFEIHVFVENSVLSGDLGQACLTVSLAPLGTTGWGGGVKELMSGMAVMWVWNKPFPAYTR